MTSLRFLLPGVLLVLAGTAPRGAGELSGEDRKFLKAHAGRLLEVIEEAREKNYEEVLEPALERTGQLREEWEEAREDGVEWASLMVGEMAIEAALEYLVWKFEEGKIAEGRAEESLRTLMEERWKIENGITKKEIEWAREEGEDQEAEELAEELVWRVTNPRRAVNEMIAEFLGELDEPEDEPEEGPDTEAVQGEVYIPPPETGEKPPDELAGVTFEYDTDVVRTLEAYCFDCHDSGTAKGDLDLEQALLDKPLVRNRLLWENVTERIRSGDMPPRKKPQPSEAERLRLRAWLRQEIEQFPYEKVRNPGYLQARRLTREENNRTIRDLIGLEGTMLFSHPRSLGNSLDILIGQHTLSQRAKRDTAHTFFV